jgi:hypothetical protein
MSALEAIQKNFPAINKVAGEFLSQLTGTNIKKDIALAAEMAGLMMLRETSVNLTQFPPGNVILGAVSDDAQMTMNRFLGGCAMMNHLTPLKNVPPIPDDIKSYLPEVTRLEKPFTELCQRNGIERNLFQFVAACTAMKLVLAGKSTKILDDQVGQAIAMFHVIAGCKTVPFPA